jgi:hypothetical protein
MIQKYQDEQNNPIMIDGELEATNSMKLIGCTSLLAESGHSGILRTRPGWGQQLVWTCRHAEQRLKNYGYAFDSSLRLRHQRPAAMGSWARWHSSYTHPTWAPPGGHSVLVRRERGCSSGWGCPAAGSNQLVASRRAQCG